MIPKQEHDAYFQPYIDLTTSPNIVEGLTTNMKTIVDFFHTIPENRSDYRYAPEKWTPKDILLHIIDTERIFCYRALRIARNDATPLAGFEQDDFVLSGNANHRTLDSLIKEYKAVRLASIALFESCDQTMLKTIGVASNLKISVRALGYMITGHENHHIKIINERYLN